MTNASQSRRAQAVIIAALLTALVTSAYADTSAVESFRNALIDYFARYNFVPVLLDRGYAIGDVVDVDGVNLYARAGRCFPKLKAPKLVETTLADVVETTSASMSFGLKLKSLFSSTAGAGLVKRIRISFSDVSVTSVARLDLGAAL